MRFTAIQRTNGVGRPCGGGRLRLRGGMVPLVPAPNSPVRWGP